MFSMQVSKSAPLATASSNGYKFTTNRSIGQMLWASIAATCAGKSRRASKPPCTTGCNVLTRPSIISGKPVASATSCTSRPASRSTLADPPVESSATPRTAKALPRSSNPTLSDTEIRARRSGARSVMCSSKNQSSFRSIMSSITRSRIPSGVSCALAKDHRTRVAYAIVRPDKTTC